MSERKEPPGGIRGFHLQPSRVGRGDADQGRALGRQIGSITTNKLPRTLPFFSGKFVTLRKPARYLAPPSALIPRFVARFLGGQGFGLGVKALVLKGL